MGKHDDEKDKKKKAELEREDSSHRSASGGSAYITCSGRPRRNRPERRLQLHG